MQLSDTDNRNGLIQEIEFWTNLGNGAVSGDEGLRAVFTNRLNRAYDAIMPLLLSVGDKMRWDDTNHADHSIATADLVSGQNDYQILADENGNSILNITDVMILDSATSTEYRPLRRILIGEPEALRAMSPNPSDTGVPYAFLEKDNTVFLLTSPNYNAENGIKFFFERQQEYFDIANFDEGGNYESSPGIPLQFHQLLALHASHDWLLVNKSENTVLIGKVEEKIAYEERELRKSIDARSRVRRRIVGSSRTRSE